MQDAVFFSLQNEKFAVTRLDRSAETSASYHGNSNEFPSGGGGFRHEVHNSLVEFEAPSGIPT